jgi:uncharacterized protein
MRIGVISDTHGFLDPRIESLFEGVDHILHGGDIGSTAIIAALENIAPTTAVLGNTDGGLSFNETEVVILQARKYLVHHIVDVLHPAEGIRDRIKRESPDVVVFGHTHKPHTSMDGRTLYFNPGYAGKPRFNLPRSVAILHCDENGIRPEFKPLS